jgi:acetyl esterase/lipase
MYSASLTYSKGGGYALPLQDYALAFWIHVQGELRKKHGVDVGIAILAYSTFLWSCGDSVLIPLVALTPDSPFPTILRQAVGGFNLLLGQGIRPENIQFAGDSAGGNLILQFLSHALHPLPTVPTISTGTISGVYLMSPWVSVSGEEGNQVEHDESDVISAIVTQHLGDTVLCDVPNFQRHYVEVLKAPDMWFDGVEKVVKRILISTGDDECFRDDNIMLNERLQKKHPDVQFILQKFGVHIDPMIDAFAGERMDGVITPKMVDWMAEGFRS